jgi:hypothetical protein
MSTAVKAKNGNGTAHPAEATQLVQLEALASQHSLANIAGKGRFEQAIMLADGMTALKDQVRPLVPRVMPLQGSPLGFLTDKDREGGYPADVVTTCLIEAVLRGVYPVGNEFNIISGRCYITKNGFARLVRCLPGLTDLKLHLGVPKVSTGGAVVPCRATWRLDGRPDAVEREIPVRLNSGMGADGALGKATRKLLAAVYQQVTGSEQGDLDGDVSDPPDSIGATRTDQGLARLAEKAGVEQATQEQLRRIDEHCQVMEVSHEDYAAKCKEIGADPARPPSKLHAEALLNWLDDMSERAAEIAAIAKEDS